MRRRRERTTAIKAEGKNQKRSRRRKERKGKKEGGKEKVKKRGNLAELRSLVFKTVNKRFYVKIKVESCSDKLKAMAH